MPKGENCQMRGELLYIINGELVFDFQKNVDQVRCSHATATGNQKRYIKSVTVVKKPRSGQPKKINVRGERICSISLCLDLGAVKEIKLDTEQGFAQIQKKKLPE